jgi:NTE family protein
VSLQRADGRDEVVGEIARGESVGEMAVLTGGTRTASVRAIRDSQLLRLSKVGFDRLVERAPGTAMKLARMLVLRLQNTTHRRTRGGAPLAIALLPASGDVPLAAFARDLVRGFAAVGSTDLIDRDTVDAALGPGAAETGGESGSGLAAWLDERERSVQFSLFAADSATSAWGGQCVRQVDRVLIAVRAGTRPDIGQIETAASSTGAPKEIVILHEAGTVAPRDTGQILSGIRRSGMHHQVGWAMADMGRLVRLLSGRGIGVVLGGGGAGLRPPRRAARVREAGADRPDRRHQYGGRHGRPVRHGLGRRDHNAKNPSGIRRQRIALRLHRTADGAHRWPAFRAHARAYLRADTDRGHVA